MAKIWHIDTDNMNNRQKKKMNFYATTGQLFSIDVKSAMVIQLFKRQIREQKSIYKDLSIRAHTLLVYKCLSIGCKTNQLSCTILSVGFCCCCCRWVDSVCEIVINCCSGIPLNYLWMNFISCPHWRLISVRTVATWCDLTLIAAPGAS